MELHILFVEGRGYYWALEGLRSLAMEGTLYRSSPQSALSDWNIVKDRLGITITPKIEFHEVD